LKLYVLIVHLNWSVFTARRQSLLALLFPLAKKVTKNAFNKVQSTTLGIVQASLTLPSLKRAFDGYASRRPTSSLQAKQKELVACGNFKQLFVFNA